jgi:predicted transcriptional regulator
MVDMLISVNPKQAIKILKGEKIFELRKSVPKDFVGWVYMYVTLGKSHEALIDFSKFAEVGTSNRFHFVNLKNSTPILQFRPVLNGKVVARWWHNEYEKIEYEITLPNGYEDEDGQWVDNSSYGYWVNEHIINGTNLYYDEIEAYGNGKDLYLWHIKRLQIFKRPMELSDFEKIIRTKEDFTIKNKTLKNIDNYTHIDITRAPSSWQYAWVKEVTDE